MFENKIDEIQTFGEITYSHHLITRLDTIPEYTHCQWILYGTIIFGALWIIFLCHDFAVNNYKRFQVRKVLPNYFQSLKVSECEDMIEDEEFFRQKGGFKILNDNSVQKLRAKLAGHLRDKEQLR